MLAKKILKVIVGLASIAVCVRAKKGDICDEIENKIGDADCSKDGNFVEVIISEPLSDSDKTTLLKYNKAIKSLSLVGVENLQGFEKLGNLEELSLEGIKKSSNLNGIGNIINLKKLTIKEMDVGVKVPEEMGELEELEYLDVSGNFLTSLPSSFGKLKNLKELNIENNKFKGEMPSAIFHMDSLESLNISRNEFTEIPRKIKYLEKLVEIYAGENSITKVTSEISSLEDLKILVLYSNLLKKIPEDLEKLENLEHLDLHDNGIDDDIPEGLNELPNLHFIDFSENTNLRGKALSNESIGVCVYENSYDLCKEADLDCLEDYTFNSCTSDDFVSTDGRCGPGLGKCPSGKCCSKYGWCGKSDKHCKKRQGCLKEYGLCK